MSQENVDRFREAAEAFNRGDIGAWLELYDSDAVFEPQIAEMEGAFVGRESIRAFFTTIADLYEYFQVDFEEMRDLGDRVLALGTVSNLGKGSGIEQRAPVAIVASFRDGRITHFKDYADRDRAIEATGLGPPGD
jgi:ketosteroid isomerase-like protein